MSISAVKVFQDDGYSHDLRVYIIGKHVIKCVSITYETEDDGSEYETKKEYYYVLDNKKWMEEFSNDAKEAILEYLESH